MPPVLCLLVAAAGAATVSSPSIPRADFNRLAASLSLPVLWTADADGDGIPDPAEVVVLGAPAARGAWVEGDGFTDVFRHAEARIGEALRQETVARELAQGRPTLLATDLSGDAPHHREMMVHLLRAADHIDGLFLNQNGGAAFLDRLPGLDAPSQALFARNHGPWCAAPATEHDPWCGAVPDLPPRRWGTWPGEAAQVPALCEAVRSRADAEALMDPFVVVRQGPDGLQAVPYTTAYAAGMAAVAAELRAAAAALPRKERGLARYLEAAARGFETNDWDAADEAWAATGPRDAPFYVRVAPDETYWDLCQEKAGFGMTLARYDAASEEWKARLLPLRQDMEEAIATLAGPGYRARKVRFQVPDFIEVIRFAGEARSPLGSTIGQALPNWGPVAEQGRGRTMVMTNIRSDADSRAVEQQQAAALLHPDALAWFVGEPPVDLDTILHEVAHNLGPTDDHTVEGRSMEAIFGGSLSTTLDELKAQSAALYYVGWLRDRGLVDDALARRIWTRSLVWALRHVAEGMTTGDGIPRTYSQLAAVQVGFLEEAGVLRWAPAGDDGLPRFAVDYERLPGAVTELLRQVSTILASGDLEAGRTLVERFVSGADAHRVHHADVADRLAGFPDITLVFSVTSGE